MIAAELESIKKNYLNFDIFFVWFCNRQKFPDYPFALDLMRSCIEAKSFQMLTDTVLNILNGLAKKTAKEVRIFIQFYEMHF